MLVPGDQFEAGFRSAVWRDRLAKDQPGAYGNSSAALPVPALALAASPLPVSTQFPPKLRMCRFSANCVIGSRRQPRLEEITHRFATATPVRSTPGAPAASVGVLRDVMPYSANELVPVHPNRGLRGAFEANVTQRNGPNSSTGLRFSSSSSAGGLPRKP